MCDTLVALPPATAGGFVVFGKNSDRERNEAQAVEMHPAGSHMAGAGLRVTRLVVPQVARTRAVLICRPCWMWGAEMGANDAGVVIGNEAVHSVRAPGREPALLGMDLVRLALERSGSAEEACAVIGALLQAHGQGGNCGHLHPHFYHNSFIVADAGAAFVLETVGREWVAERAAGVRTISNAYTTPGMRAHADAALEAKGDGPARCARTTALLMADAGRIGVAQAMAALRDHGPEAAAGVGAGWHPQDTVGRTVCMHAGAGERRGQTVGSMVSELRPGGAVHWVTGTAAPCTSVFKPVVFGAVVPDFGPRPSDRADKGSLWWRHERLHRSLMRGSGVPGWLVAERDALEASFLGRPDAVAECWAEAAAAEARWLARLDGDITARGDYLGSWRSLDLLAGLG